MPDCPPHPTGYIHPRGPILQNSGFQPVAPSCLPVTDLIFRGGRGYVRAPCHPFLADPDKGHSSRCPAAACPQRVRSSVGTCDRPLLPGTCQQRGRTSLNCPPAVPCSLAPCLEVQVRVALPRGPHASRVPEPATRGPYSAAPCCSFTLGGRICNEPGCSPQAVCPFGLERASLLGPGLPVSWEGPSRAGAQGSVRPQLCRGPLALGTFQALGWPTAPGSRCPRLEEEGCGGRDGGHRGWEAPTRSTSAARSQTPAAQAPWVSRDFVATDPGFPRGGSAFCLE